MRNSTNPFPAAVGMMDRRWRLGSPAAIVRMLGNETDKGLLTLWAHRGTLLPELAGLGALYLFFQFIIGGGHLVHAIFAPTLLGFAAYSFAYLLTLKTVAGTLEEMNTGTLEQSHLSPLPAWLLSVGRLGAALVEGLVVTGLIMAALVLILGIDLPPRWQAMVPATLTVLDIAGFALLLGGLALAITSIGAVLHVLQGIILMLNGSLVPVNLFPAWLEVIARLLPSTLGVEVTRKVLVGGQSLPATWSDHSLLWLLLHTAGMLLVGSAIYQWNIRQALRNGRLGPR